MSGRQPGPYPARSALALSLALPGAEQLARLQDVVARYLVLFAFREDLVIDWREHDHG